MTLFTTATKLAERYHDGQTRKDGAKYFTHPYRTSERLVQLGITDVKILSAAVCHDLLEDTTITEKEIEDTLGTEVLTLVRWLTKVKEEPKDAYIKRFEQAPWQAVMIKLSDRWDNLTDIVNLGNEQARKYAVKTYYLLAAIGKNKLDGCTQENRDVINKLMYNVHQQIESILWQWPPIGPLVNLETTIGSENSLNLTNEELDIMESRARAATSGKWMRNDIAQTVDYFDENIALSRERGDIPEDVSARRVLCSLGGSANPNQDKNDRDFISHSRDDVLRLVTELRRLREEVTRFV